MHKHSEFQYLNVLQRLVDEYEKGNIFPDRTGAGIVKILGAQLEFSDIDQIFPIITTRMSSFYIGKVELLWMLGLLGDPSNIRPLVIRNVNIWNEWPMVRWLTGRGIVVPKQDDPLWSELMEEFVDGIKNDEKFAQKHGSLGPTYGVQMVSWETKGGKRINQVQNVINALKTNPFSRRIIINLWNVADIGKMALPPCLFFYQFDRGFSHPGDPSSALQTGPWARRTTSLHHP